MPAAHGALVRSFDADEDGIPAACAPDRAHLLTADGARSGRPSRSHHLLSYRRHRSVSKTLHSMAYCEPRRARARGRRLPPSTRCCRCLGSCGPWEENEAAMGKKIRGLRRCTQRDCMLPLNRDKNGATNIGTNFMRLFEDKTPVRSMSDEDLAFHRASLCLECE